MKTYIKNDEVVGTHEKFIYNVEIYVVWKNGISLYDEKNYACDKPLKFKKKDNLLKRKKYKLVRYITLTFAPQHYLENNGYYEDR